MKAKIQAYILAIGSYLLRKVLLYDLGVAALIGLSFLVWKGFSAAELSNRLVWTGIGIALISGFLFFSNAVGGRNYGMPTYTAALSSTLIDWNIEIRKKIDQTFDFRFQIFLFGLFAFLAGILVDTLTH